MIQVNGSDANRLLLSLAIPLLLFAGIAPSQSVSVASSTHPLRQDNGFIVAFDLSPEKGFNFIWPYESMKPAPYETVLMKIKKMPRVFNKRSGQTWQLLASQCLKVNGMLQKPLRIKTNEPGEQFEVKLRQGRLRFSLRIPEGAILDEQYQIARIELYEVKPMRNFENHSRFRPRTLLFRLLQSFSPTFSGHFT
ncbi:MAG: hypothetical protein AB1757_03360 [Acidobacteriota bacterium]